jgi:predicted enzyme related to lactoylglutathione lyase
MITDVTHVTVLVDDQDAALAFYTDTLGFAVADDEEMEEGGRWVTVAPAEGGTRLALVAADSAAKRERVGTQAADHVLLVLESDDCRADYERLSDAGVEFHGEVREVPWGVDCVFEDPYGNVFNLVEPRAPGA